MWEALGDWVGASYAPHGYCLLWRPWLVWTMAGSDALIALAYFSIPVALVTFVRRRRDVAFSGVFWLFALFITACGLTHLLSIWNLWHGDYQLEALTKLVTAGASVVTAIMLWPMLPRAIALPSPAHLRAANDALRAEIAEREKTEAALVQARKMEAMGQLTGGIAHDFNNLLQVLSGSVELIANRSSNDERLHRLASTALAAIDRGRRLTNQLLTFSRIQRIELKPLRVADLLASLQDMLGRTLGPSIELKFSNSGAADSVLADAVQLELALVNLALNARDAMPDGGRLSIAICDRFLAGRADVEDGDYLAISVSDTGCGIAPDLLDRVFEPFFTTKPVGCGSGLGLSMVFGMARQSGGTVTIDSAPAQGTNVTIFLRHVSAPLQTNSVADETATCDRASLSGVKILVVDDEPIVRQVTADILEDMGCIVLTAEDGRTAIDMVPREQPAAMLLDFAMPGMNGADVARAVLADYPDIRCVFATGFAQSDAIDAAVGPDAIVLRKPFSPQVLATALSKVLENGSR